MTTETHPPVSEAMREAVALQLKEHFGLTFSEAIRYADEACRPIASDIARLTGERDAAREEVEAVKEWAGEPEGWPSLKVKWDALVSAAEEDHARAAAAEADLTRMRAENARLRAALDPFGSFGRHWVDAEGWTCNTHRESISTWFGPSEFRSAAALSNPEQTDA